MNMEFESRLSLIPCFASAISKVYFQREAQSKEKVQRKKCEKRLAVSGAAMS
jgi:hypothetical protein